MTAHPTCPLFYILSCTSEIKFRHSCASRSTPGPPARLCSGTDSCWARGLAALILMSGRPSLFEWVFLRRRNCTPLDLESALPLLPVLARLGPGDNAPLSSARRTAL